MTVWDDRLLEYAAENESVSAAKVKDLDVFRVSRSTISRRLKKLANHGMLLDLGNGVYTITDEGEAYLDGDLDASSLEDQSPENGETAQS
jgi:DeoR/GlpR family transcriptional regulator of sugar metabolism